MGGDLRQQSDFADFEASAPWKSRIFMKILHHDRSGETWPRSGFLLARSMDVRLGACESSLHFRNWKINPAQTNLAFHEKSMIFVRKGIHNLRVNSQDTKILNQKEHLTLHRYKSLYLSFYAIFLFLLQEKSLF